MIFEKYAKNEFYQDLLVKASEESDIKEIEPETKTITLFTEEENIGYEHSNFNTAETEDEVIKTREINFNYNIIIEKLFTHLYPPKYLRGKGLKLYSIIAFSKSSKVSGLVMK